MSALINMDTAALRRSLGKFVTGVTVVTTRAQDGLPRGFTASSFTSVSLDPPLVLVCVARSAGSYATFERAVSYAVNVLTEDQQQLSMQFASHRPDKFSGVQWWPGPLGDPLIANTAAWLDCRIHDRRVAGDHLILIGRVESFSSSPVRPLAYFQGRYVSLSTGAVRSDVYLNRATVSGILLNGESILLIEDSGGTLTLPTGAGIGRPDRPGTLLGELHGMGIDTELGSVIGLLDEQPDGTVHAVVDGRINFLAAVDPRYTLVPLAQIRWERLAGPHVRRVVRDYLGKEILCFADNATLPFFHDGSDDRISGR